MRTTPSSLSQLLSQEVSLHASSHRSSRQIGLVLGLVSLLSVGALMPVVASDGAEQAAPASDLEEHIKIAEEGNVEAQYGLALRYLGGGGMKADPKMAIFWLKRAIDQKYPKAVYRYAKLFEEGKAVPMNAKIAAEWYLKAAEMGVVGAQRKMGALYRDGKGVAKDPVAAYAWYNVASSVSGAVQDKIHREYIGFGLSPAELEKAQMLSDELAKAQK